jgi:chemotaxis signal transduction protein
MQKSTGGFRTPLQQLFLLEERARLAGVHLPDEKGMDNQRFHGVKCVINGLESVINMRHVVEAIDDRKVTPIPGTAGWIEGVMNYRGTMVPVYRIHEFLNLGANADSKLATLDGPILAVKKITKGKKSNDIHAIRVNRMIGMQKFREVDLQPLNQEHTASDTLEHYVNSIISSEGKKWYLIDINSLLEVMSGTNPRKM